MPPCMSLAEVLLFTPSGLEAWSLSLFTHLPFSSDSYQPNVSLITLPLHNLAPPTSPGTTSTPSSNDTSASTSSRNPTITSSSFTEPVQPGGEAPSEGDNSSSPDVCTTEARPDRVEGVKAEDDGHVDGSSQGPLPSAAANSSPLSATTAGEQDAYYSWWSYVGWGSTTSINEGGTTTAGAAGSADAAKPVGSDGSEAAALTSTATVDSGEYIRLVIHTPFSYLLCSNIYAFSFLFFHN